MKTDFENRFPKWLQVMQREWFATELRGHRGGVFDL